MNEIKQLTDKILKFRDARDWKQFHNSKDVALSMVLEAAELMEHFQWKTKEEAEAYALTHKKEIGEELADVAVWVFLLSHDLGIDIKKAILNKIQKNKRKYPIKKARGKHTKYNKL